VGLEKVMAIITCNECGRAVSNRAVACIGCGAPLAPKSVFNLVPTRSVTPPLTRSQIKLRAFLASVTFALGVIWALALDQRPGRSQLAATMAALLIISGICWLLVTFIQGVASRK
jgi:hypothetical protein